ncbi:cell wall anchored protein [Colletotrichum truncatum]|uniref:Cell wall anchored protein n=1 Tax=Colletotrichum truncatum TaxID=5467 RepID=A0ACC3YJ20_COLTU|nr:cell wall anchored protein [Colletotrichum truncatum]KAF6797154.1 cell wall anchored protein [Colletotrichum truncatum]
MSLSRDRKRSAVQRREVGSQLKTMPLLGAFILTLFVTSAAGQEQPCRRWGQQATVVDNKLYIDGGFSTIGGDINSNTSYKEFLWQNLTSETPNDQPPPVNRDIVKNNTVPNLNGGALWGDSINKRIYLFGGEYNYSPPSPVVLWSYDILNNRWDTHGAPPVNRVSYGSSVAIDKVGEAYYYGGWLSKQTVPNWTGPPVATTGLVKYVMDSDTWYNTSDSGPDTTRRAEGSLQYIPAGTEGLLVYFGGVQDLYSNGTVTGQPMDQIFVYDLGNEKWYQQNATGSIPSQRRRFCAGTSWTADQSSYNIYMYGGATMDLAGGYSDLYVLSLPTFTWVKLSDGAGTDLRHSASCNVVAGGTQMFVVGGVLPNSSLCDAPKYSNTHVIDLGFPGTGSFWSNYYPKKVNYTVPDGLLAVVGGTSSGGATQTAPKGDWMNAELKALMARNASNTARMPTRTASPVPVYIDDDGISVGAIAGVSVASAAVIALLAVGCCFMVRRRRRRQRYYTAGGFRNSQQLFNTTSMSKAWSAPTPHLSVSTPYSPAFGHSPFGPPPSHTPQPEQVASPPMSPPVELPSVSPVPSLPITPIPVSAAAVAAAAAAASQTMPTPPPPVATSSLARSSSITYTPHSAYFPETGTFPNQAQIDEQGNVWVPQVSMVQVASLSRPESHTGTPPMYTPPIGDRKSPLPAHPTPPIDYHPTPPPQQAYQVPVPQAEPVELPASPQETSEEYLELRNSRGSRHQTYYNK